MDVMAVQAPLARVAELEITGRCQLECTHCYAGSGPLGTHGSMTASDWRDAITAAAAAGVVKVQFIGGEPSLHPALPDLIRHALAQHLAVRVFTNLVRTPARCREAYTLPGVSLATSWYTADPVVHTAITGRDSHAATVAGIRWALGRGVPLQVSVVTGVHRAQHEDAAVAMLRSLGVTDISVGPAGDFGRGTRIAPDAVCGHCGDSKTAITPDGQVHPCVMARWVSAGDVREGDFAALASLAAQMAAPLREKLRGQCPPSDGNDCNPATTPACRPAY